jgi:proteasome alpha subunit
MEPISQNYMAYDRTITVFSPDGRLLQVEYARQAVIRGSTCIGLKTNEAVILGAIKTSTPLAVNESFKKIYEIDKHVGAVCSGLLADARDLIEMARIKAQISRITFNEPISVKSVATYIADHKHMVTQYAGVRPYGVGLLIGGVDSSGARLYETDPSGTLIEWKAQSLGKDSEKVRKVLKASYKEAMSVKDGIGLVLKALRSGDKETKIENIEIAVITKNKFERLSGKEIAKHE